MISLRSPLFCLNLLVSTLKRCGFPLGFDILILDFQNQPSQFYINRVIKVWTSVWSRSDRRNLSRHLTQFFVSKDPE